MFEELHVQQEQLDSQRNQENWYDQNNQSPDSQVLCNSQDNYQIQTESDYTDWSPNIEFMES